MSKASNYLEGLTIDYFFRHQQVTQPNQIYLALYKTNPTDADTGAEITGGSYERQLLAMTAPTQKSDSAVTTNNERIEFPRASSEWGEIAYFGVRDAKTGGNLLVYGAFNKPINIMEGNQFIIDDNNLEINVS